jgi:hypothetical protein
VPTTATGKVGMAYFLLTFFFNRGAPSPGGV